MTTETFTEVGQYRPSIDVSPGFELDYYFDWADWCDHVSDSISTKTVVGQGVTVNSSEIVAGVTEDGDAVANSRVKVWLTDKLTEPAIVTCTIVTVGGRTDSRKFYLLDR
jgi:hypothetical protein